MLIFHSILALAAVAVVARRPASVRGAAAAALLGALDVASGAPLTPALPVVAPLAAFLGAALTLAGIVHASGLVERAAALVAAAARGRAAIAYVLVCVLCSGLTAIVSLDGAVILTVPVVLVL